MLEKIKQRIKGIDQKQMSEMINYSMIALLSFAVGKRSANKKFSERDFYNGFCAGVVHQLDVGVQTATDVTHFKKIAREYSKHGHTISFKPNR